MDKVDTQVSRVTSYIRCVSCICVNLVQGGRPQSKALGHKEVAGKTYCIGRFAVLPKLISTSNPSGLN
jgi:hypothetical protein